MKLNEVIRALEGPITLGEKAADKGQENDEVRRVTESVFGDLSQRVEECFAAVSVSDICTRADELGLPRPGARRYVYVI